jgi:HNH endonuclease
MGGPRCDIPLQRVAGTTGNLTLLASRRSRQPLERVSGTTSGGKCPPGEVPTPKEGDVKSTNRAGREFPEHIVQAVWNKAALVPGYKPDIVRKDACGAWISRQAYGIETEYGWEIDHIQPVAHGGSDDLWNLQPLQWQNNRHKGDSWPNWTCAVVAS